MLTSIEPSSLSAASPPCIATITLTSMLVSLGASLASREVKTSAARPGESVTHDSDAPKAGVGALGEGRWEVANPLGRGSAGRRDLSRNVKSTEVCASLALMGFHMWFSCQNAIVFPGLTVHLNFCLHICSLIGLNWLQPRPGLWSSTLL